MAPCDAFLASQIDIGWYELSLAMQPEYHHDEDRSELISIRFFLLALGIPFSRIVLG
jgi:hypothetical protein